MAGGLNLYGFAGGDPVNFSDPFGLCVFQIAICQKLASIGAGFVAREVARSSMNYPALANVPQGPDASVLHQMGGQSGNQKFLSPDGHHESVRDASGSEVTGENAATYNYGTNAAAHVALDILPWIAVGTGSPGDNTTIPGRIRKLLTGAFVKPCVQDQVCAR